MASAFFKQNGMPPAVYAIMACTVSKKALRMAAERIKTVNLLPF